ncbi:MAG: GPR endopeptidase [Clostridia bacterium]|nr:GPR endopeptidase [Clostridia bacterium]
MKNASYFKCTTAPQSSHKENVSRFLRTDLACEAPSPSDAEDSAGASYWEYRRGNISVARLQIDGKEGEIRFQREIGTYVTVTTGQLLLLSPEDLSVLNEILVSELRRMAERLSERPIDHTLRVLVAGLGNAHMTADALGPETASILPVTRHLRDSEDPALLNEGRRYASISVIVPGVLAQTGIETLELIQGAVRTVHPDLLIAVDALAARSCERLATTVQLSDTGIRPGSGIGNHREALSRETVGCPVIAIGVPTVVDSSALVYDALARAGIREGEISPELFAVLENGRSFFVSPKEIDALTKAFSELLSGAIADAFTVTQ